MAEYLGSENTGELHKFLNYRDKKPILKHFTTSKEQNFGIPDRKSSNPSVTTLFDRRIRKDSDWLEYSKLPIPSEKVIGVKRMYYSYCVSMPQFLKSCILVFDSGLLSSCSTSFFLPFLEALPSIFRPNNDCNTWRPQSWCLNIFLRWSC